MIDAIARQLKALAHPQRLKLLALIRERCFCCYTAEPGSGSAVERNPPAGACVGDLAGECDIAPSTVSHHLKELRTAGLIAVERRGQFLYCRAREDVLAALAAYLAAAPERAAVTPPHAGAGGTTS
jgi:ArsR family transcriptional regulator